MKKFLFFSMITAVLFSCAGFGGDKIETDDLKSVILQVMLDCQGEMESQLSAAMYEKDYVFAANTATMNVKFSTMCGLKTSEKTAYEVSLNQWTKEMALSLTTADLERNSTANCKITISGNLKGSTETSRWASSASNVVMNEFSFSNADTDGLNLTVYNNETGKNVYTGAVFILTEVSASTGQVGGNFKKEARINGYVFEAPVKIWTNYYGK